jgi:alkylresorcinol/alkylpyrone synthase
MDKKDMVALALFADGCAAAVIGAGSGPQLDAFASHVWPDTLDMMVGKLAIQGLIWCSRAIYLFS